MTSAVCPKCGTDLELFEPLQRGDVCISPHEVSWKGRPVKLTPSGRLLVSAVVRANGKPVSTLGLSEAIGCEECANPYLSTRVQLCYVRRAFKAVDPSFNAIETVLDTGIRWAA